MSERTVRLSLPQADAIYTILCDLAGASERGRAGFLHHQTTDYVTEYRFMGALGFGGKFWRNHTRRPDGTWGECWYVNTYRELEDDARLKLIAATNLALDELREQVGPA